MREVTNEMDPPMRFLATLILGGCLLANLAIAQTRVHTNPARLFYLGDVSVWVNTRSGVYHYQGERYYGSAKLGKFVCEKAARVEGNRPTKNGQ